MTSLIKRKATPGTAPERLPVTPSVIKKLFAYSVNRCADPSRKQGFTSVEA